MPSRIRLRLKAPIGLAIAAIVSAMMGPLPVAAATEQDQLVEKARLTVEAFAADPQQQELHRWISRSKGLFIVPQILRGAFVFGGAGGGGVLLVHDEQNGEW